MVNVSFGNAATAAAGGTTDATPLVNGSTVDLTDNLTDANLSGSGGTLGSLLGLYDSTTGTGKIADYRPTRRRGQPVGDHGQQRDLGRRRERVDRSAVL